MKQNKVVSKVLVKNQMVEIGGDDPARSTWQMVKEKLIQPYLDIKLEYFDLSLTNRAATGDQVTREAASVLKKFKVGVKCATITPDSSHLRELGLKSPLTSPNATIRNELGGTIFREPIIFAQIPPLLGHWKKPVIIGRHAFGDQYSAVDLGLDAGSRVSLEVVDCRTGKKSVHQMCELPEKGGVAVAMFNTRQSVDQFATRCFEFALLKRLPLYLSTKNTILKQYDRLFMKSFEEAHERFRDLFKKASITYEHRLIDDMVAFMMKSEGGFIWACKNYDGDVESGLVSQCFGSQELMTSVLLSEDGAFLSETVQAPLARQASSDPISAVFAWSRGLSRLAAIEQNCELGRFCEVLEESVARVIRSGRSTVDLANRNPGELNPLSSPHFIEAVAEELHRLFFSFSPKL